MSKNKKIEIIPYIGYANDDTIYCFGRILEARNLWKSRWNKWWTNAINTFKRLESDEISHQAFEYEIYSLQKEDVTNSEGYYKLKEKLKSNEIQNGENRIKVKLKQNDPAINQKIEEVGIILKPHQECKVAIVSDIDDTIMQTDVLIKWKLIYNTIFLSAKQRKAVHKMNVWFQELAQRNCTFYYISNSPWNFYDNLSEFIRRHAFPLGPILLRDFGFQQEDSLQAMAQHKKNEIEHLIEFYQDLQFILIGDGGEKDAYIYLDLKNRFPDRIKAIFIRRLGDLDHQAKIEEAMRGHESYFYFTKDTDEAITISRQMQWF